MGILSVAPLALQHSLVEPRRTTQEEIEEQIVNVFIRMWDGKTLCCAVESETKKNGSSIQDQLEVHVLKQYGDDVCRRDFYMEFGGKPLRRQHPTSIIKEGSTVFCHYRNRGGCFIFSISILTIIVMSIIGSTCTCGLSLVVVPLLLPLLCVLPFFCL